MREIKFRAWSWKDRQMYEDVGVYEGQTYIQAEKTYDTPNSEFIRLKGDVALMQFTGLHDKNGKEIYEGDIVCFVDDVVVETIGGFDRTEPEGKFREVAWNQLHCGWGLFENGGQSEDMLADWINEDGSVPRQWECKELEVIGNIYENGDLLK